MYCRFLVNPVMYAPSACLGLCTAWTIAVNTRKILPLPTLNLWLKSSELQKSEMPLIYL